MGVSEKALVSDFRSRRIPFSFPSKCQIHFNNTCNEQIYSKEKDATVVIV